MFIFTRLLVYILWRTSTINVLRNIFEGEGGEIPASVSGDNILWLLEYEHLQTMMADRPQAEVKMQIDLLMKRFPTHQDELQVIASSLLNSYDAIHAWHMAIGMAEHSKRFEIALQCARIAVAQGLLWDGADFYNIVLNTGSGSGAETSWPEISSGRSSGSFSI